MKNELQAFAADFTRIYQGTNWYGNSFQEIISDMKAEVAFATPPGNRNSVAQIVKHMMDWRIFVLERMQGHEQYTVEQTDTFDISAYAAADENAWAALVGAYEQVQQKLVYTLETAQPGLLLRPVPQQAYNMRHLVQGIQQHDLYHMGQIGLLKKQLQQLQEQGATAAVVENS